MEKLREIFEIAGKYMPHGYCFQWEAWVFWTLLLTNLIIGLCYISNFFAIRHFVKARVDIKHRWIIMGFGVFIGFCGITHVLHALSLFRGIYDIVGIVKTLQAFISVPVAIAVWPAVKYAVKMPSLEAYYMLKDQVNKLEAERKEEAKKVVELTDQLKKLRAAHEHPSSGEGGNDERQSN